MSEPTVNAQPKRDPVTKASKEDDGKNAVAAAASSASVQQQLNHYARGLIMVQK